MKMTPVPPLSSVSPVGSARPFPRRALLWTPLALALPFALPAPARQSEVAPTLLVRGESTLMSDQSFAWRVVRDVAEVAPAAAFEQRALGFAVASSLFGTLLLTDELTGTAFRLNHSDAAFVRDGTMQRRESLGRTAESYLRIGLVSAADVADAGGDQPIFAGAAFPMHAGPITLSLHRAELAEGDTVDVSPGAGQQLILVEQGDVELEERETGARELLRTTVGSGTSYAVRSVDAATLYGARAATSVLLASLA